MKEELMMDAVERYLNKEMSADESSYFEELRRNNADLDLAVVEQTHFLDSLGKYAQQKRFKKSLHSMEVKLKLNGTIESSNVVPMQQSPIVSMFKRYKKTIAVAACIAGLVSILLSTAVNTIDKSGKNASLTPLISKIKAQDLKTEKLQQKVNALEAATPELARTPIASNFRATGFMIDATNNYIVTNAHVTNQAKNQLIVENGKGEQFVAQVVYVNKNDDIAVVKIVDERFKKLPTVPYSIKNKNTPLGQQVFLLGFPKQEIVYTEGYVSASNGYDMDTSFCQLVTMANVGNSGSPVINKQGEVIGVISSRETNDASIVFATKSANIYRAIQEAKKKDTANNIKISAISKIKGLSRETQITRVSDYVFMIKGN